MKKFKAIPGKGIFASNEGRRDDYYYRIGAACLSPEAVSDIALAGRYFDPTTQSFKDYEYEFKTEADRIRAEEEVGKALESLYTELVTKTHQVARKYATGAGDNGATTTLESGDGIEIGGQFLNFLIANLNADSDDVSLVAHNNWGDRMTPDEFADELYDAAISNGISPDELDYDTIRDDVADAFSRYDA